MAQTGTGMLMPGGFYFLAGAGSPSQVGQRVGALALSSGLIQLSLQIPAMALVPLPTPFYYLTVSTPSCLLWSLERFP